LILKGDVTLKKIEKIKRYAVAGSLILHVFRYIKKIILTAPSRCRRKADLLIGILVRKLIYSKGKIQNNKLFVMTYDYSYSCNPKYIVEEILRQGLPIKIVWAVPAKGPIPEQQFPVGIDLVRYGSYTMYAEMATSKVWLDNALNCVWNRMPKKPEQIYLNTWHGSMGIKKLNGNKTWLHRAKRCNKITDYCISNSEFEEKVYHDTFWKDIPCLKYGHARNDIFFNQNTRDVVRDKVCAFFDIEKKAKIFLYAPTFRDDGNMEWFKLDFENLKQCLDERFGGEWTILVRMHFKNRKKRMKISDEQFWLKDASQYGDMQELLVASDAGMTDYSSWAYDYILTKRPLFLYAPDLSTYDYNRGFYYPLETTPFPLAQKENELFEAILQFDYQEYLPKVEAFLSEKGCYEDGKAGIRAVGFIKNIMKLDDLAPMGDESSPVDL